jgi:hypothetical protein
MKKPKFKKDLVGKVVTLKEPHRNNGGQLFIKNVPMIVTGYDKESGEASIRPFKGVITLNIRHLELVGTGDKSDLGFSRNQ